MQRCTRAEVRVADRPPRRIGAGLMVLLGVAADDTPADAEQMAAKLPNLRIFDDENGSLNLSLLDVDGAVLLVSQFTLLGDARKGRRPSFVGAARGQAAEDLYEQVAHALRARGIPVETGVFGAHMQVDFVNDGPVTILLDSRKVF